MSQHILRFLPIHIKSYRDLRGPFGSILLNPDDWSRGAEMKRSILSPAATSAVLLTMLCGVGLGACSKKTDATSEAPRSQVAAKVGDQVVTVQELDNELRLVNVPVEKRKDPEVIKRVLGELVTRKYMVQQAIEAKLDREPTVLLDILRAKDVVLANALATRDITTKSGAVSKADIDNYIANNPQKFANRQLLSVEQISFALAATTQAVIDATREMKTLDEVDQKLTVMGIPHGRSSGAVSTGDLPPDLMNAVSAHQADDIFFIRSGNNGLFFKVTNQESRPLEGQEALNAARQYLRQDIIKTDLSMTSVAATMGAKYEGDYAAIMKVDVGAPTGAK
jgi:EpsD family peptidyl-prolyl cis-trans isomerase